MTEFVRFRVTDGVDHMVLDRPPVNALNVEMQRQFTRVSLQADEDPAVRAVVITGGEVFAAGADIKEIAGLSSVDMSLRARALSSNYTSIAQIGKPVIAAVRGFALGGGCEIALCADFRVAGESARIGLPEITLGLIPGAGGTQRLSRLIGPARTKELLFSGRFVDAEEALHIGLVDRVVPDADVEAAAAEWAATYVSGPMHALRAAKQAVDQGLELPLEAGLDLESALFSGLFATQDAAEGIRSFAENGPGRATFTGR